MSHSTHKTSSFHIINNSPLVIWQMTQSSLPVEYCHEQYGVYLPVIVPGLDAVALWARCYWLSAEILS